LSENFNASQLKFGYELNYDDVVNVLLKCDDRIKNIRLESFSYKTKAVKRISSGDGYEELDVYSI